MADNRDSDVAKQAENLLAKALKHVDKFEYDVAQSFCERSLHLDPNNIRALETSSSLLLEIGELEKAKLCLERAIRLSPDRGYSKFFSLAQLVDGKESIELYDRGLKLIKEELESLSEGNEQEKNRLRRELSNAYCSIAEIYTTDLCFEENAESECVNNISKAIDTDPNNPEAYQSKANFLLIKQNKEEAKIEMQKSLSLWLPQMQAVMEGKAEASDPFEVCSMSYDSRISAAKILIELEEYESVSDVLEGLLSEDDQIFEVWYLSGLTNFLRGDDFKGNARYYLNKARKVAAKTAVSDPEVLQHVDELLTELGPDENGDDDNDSEDEENIDENIETASSEEDEETATMET